MWRRMQNRRTNAHKNTCFPRLASLHFPALRASRVRTFYSRLLPWNDCLKTLTLSPAFLPWKQRVTRLKHQPSNYSFWRTNPTPTNFASIYYFICLLNCDLRLSLLKPFLFVSMFITSILWRIGKSPEGQHTDNWNFRWRKQQTSAVSYQGTRSSCKLESLVQVPARNSQNHQTAQEGWYRSENAPDYHPHKFDHTRSINSMCRTSRWLQKYNTINHWHSKQIVSSFIFLFVTKMGHKTHAHDFTIKHDAMQCSTV